MPDLPLPDPPALIAIEREIELVRVANFKLLPRRNACAESEPGTIVVCGPRPAEDYLPGPSLPRQPTAMEEIGEKLRLRFGPAEIGIVPMSGSAGGIGAGVGLRIRF